MKILIIIVFVDISRALIWRVYWFFKGEWTETFVALV